MAIKDDLASLDKRVLDLLEDWRSEGGSLNHSFLGLIAVLVRMLDQIQAEYAFDGSVAVRLHGGTSAHQDVRIRLHPDAWQRSRAKYADRFDFYSQSRREGMMVLREARYTAQVQFRDDAAKNGVSLFGLTVVPLSSLIFRRLLSGDPRERKEVVTLIRANGLDETFGDSLPAMQLPHYSACLLQARGEETD